MPIVVSLWMAKMGTVGEMAVKVVEMSWMRRFVSESQFLKVVELESLLSEFADYTMVVTNRCNSMVC